MEVTDLGDAEGMLFVFDDEAVHRFYMWQTPMPLDIAFFAADGTFVGTAAMEPCLAPSATSASGTRRTSRSSWRWRCRPATLDDLGVGPGARVQPQLSPSVGQQTRQWPPGPKTRGSLRSEGCRRPGSPPISVRCGATRRQERCPTRQQQACGHDCHGAGRATGLGQRTLGRGRVANRRWVGARRRRRWVAHRGSRRRVDFDDHGEPVTKTSVGRVDDPLVAVEHPARPVHRVAGAVD